MSNVNFLDILKEGDNNLLSLINEQEYQFIKDKCMDIVNNTTKAPDEKPKIPLEKYDPPIIDNKLTPIEDITIITGNEICPTGYHKLVNYHISQTNPPNLYNKFICIKRGILDPICDVTIVYPRRKEHAPRGWTYVTNYYSKQIINLNDHTTGPCCYLCYSKLNTVPLCDIDIQNNMKQTRSYGYIPILYSPSLNPIILCNVDQEFSCSISIYRDYDSLYDLNLVNDSVILRTPSPKRQHKKLTIFFDTTLDYTDPYIPDEENEVNNITDANTPLHMRKKLKYATSISDGKMMNQSVVHSDIKPRSVTYLVPLLIGCCCKDNRIINNSIQTFQQLLNTNYYSVVNIVTSTPIYDIIIDYITESASIYPIPLWSSLYSFLINSLKFYKKGISTVSMAKLLISLIDGFLKDCKVKDELNIEQLKKFDSVYSLVSSLIVIEPIPEYYIQIQTNNDKLSIASSLLYEIIEISTATEILQKYYLKLICQPPFSSELILLLQSVSRYLSSSIFNQNFIQLIFLGVVYTSISFNKQNFSTEILTCRIFGLRLLQNCLLNGIKFITHDNVYLHIVKYIILPSILENLYIDKYRQPMLLGPFMELFNILWKSYKEYMFAELSIIYNILNRILCSVRLNASLKLIILDYYENIFNIPTDIIEIFINYDCNSDIPYNVLESTVSTLSLVIENTYEMKDELDEINDIQLLREKSLNILVNIQKVAMNANCTVYYEMTESWSKDKTEDSLSPASSSSTEHTSGNNQKKHNKPAKRESILFNLSNGLNIFPSSVRKSLVQQQLSSKAIDEAFKIVKEKDSLKKGLQYLLSMGYLKSEPETVSNFISLHQDKVSEEQLGAFLGENGSDLNDENFFSKVRLCYIGRNKYNEMKITDALRILFTQSGFKLPSDAQVIERIIDTFSQCYYNDNPDMFSNPRVCSSLTFAIIILNSELHDPNISDDNKKTVNEFIEQNRGINEGNDLSESLLTNIYNEVLNNPINLSSGSNSNATSDVSSVNNNNNNEDGNNGSGGDDDDIYLHNIMKIVRSGQVIIKSLKNKIFKYNRDTSPDTVRVLSELLLPETIPLCGTIFKSYRIYRNVSAEFLMSATDLITYAISNAIFLNNKDSAKSACIILKHFELEFYLSDPTFLMQNQNNSEWYDIIINNNKKLSTSEVVSLFQTDMLEFKRSIENRIVDIETNRVYDRLYGNIKMLIYERNLECEGNVNWITNDNVKNEVRFFLFNDILLIASLGYNNRYFIIYTIYLNDLEILLYDNNILSIISGGKHLIFQCDTVEESIQWYNTINDLNNININSPYKYETENSILPSISSTTSTLSNNNNNNNIVRDRKLSELFKHNNKKINRKETRVVSNIPCLNLGMFPEAKKVGYTNYEIINDKIQSLIRKSQKIGNSEDDKVLNIIGYYLELLNGDYHYREEEKDSSINPFYINSWKKKSGLSYETCVVKLVELINEIDDV